MKNKMIAIKKINIILVFAMIMALLLIGCASSNTSNSTEPVTEVSSSDQTTSNPNENATENSQPTTDNSINKMNKIGLYVHHKELVTHELISEYASNWEKGKDIECFEAFTTDVKSIQGSIFKTAWEPYWYNFTDADNYKIGYYLSFSLNSSEVFTKTIKKPSDTATYMDYIELYIYDDVHQQPGVWYTHLSEPDIKDNTFMTSIKLTAGNKISEVKEIKLTAFTYSSDKEFDPVTGKYIGNNSYEITVSRSK